MTLNLPANLEAWLDEHEFWEGETDRIFVLIDRQSEDGKPLTSFQILATGNKQNDGYALEEGYIAHLQQQAPELLEKLKSDTELSACVIWADNVDDFEKALRHMRDYTKKIQHRF